MTSLSPLAAEAAKLPHDVDLLRCKPQRISAALSCESTSVCRSLLTTRARA